MKKRMIRIAALMLCITFSISLSACEQNSNSTNISADSSENTSKNSEIAENLNTGDVPDMGDAPDSGGTPDMGGTPDSGDAPDMGGTPDSGGAPDMGGGSGLNISTTTYRCKEGSWSFRLEITENGDETTSKAVLTGWDTDTNINTLIIPSVLGGAPVTEIESTAISRANNIKAVFIPETVTYIHEFSFYDLNGLEYISCANPNVEIEDGALTSCNNTEITTSGTETGTSVSDTQGYAIAGGIYIISNNWSVTEKDIASLVSAAENGTYEIKEVKGAEIYDGGFTDDNGNDVSLTEDDFCYTFRNLSSSDDYNSFMDELENSSFSSISIGLINYSGEGYYLNGNKVELSDAVKAYDASTGELLPEILSTGGAYSYVAYRDFDNDGLIDALYYTDGSITDALDQNAVIISDNELLNGKDTASSLEGKYLAFANGVIESFGVKNIITYNTLSIGDTGDSTYEADGKTKNADAVDASINRERSILWADDYSQINVDYLNASSSSYANWAKETYEAGDSTYNYEVNMQFGIGAGLYATNGGQITVGDLDGKTSRFSTYGDTGNGAIAIGGGTETGNENAPFSSSSVTILNTIINAQGWNSHIVDCIYGGYAYLEDVTGTTGVEGSYLGQSSALANDFGAGVIEVVDSEFTTYGNGSAGAYVIGENSGYIKATDTIFTSLLDSGLCTAGGTFEIYGGQVSGIIALRARASGASSTLSGVKLIKADVETNYSGYVTGNAAYEAAAAWQTASGDESMPGPELSNQLVGIENVTLGEICDAYDISEEARTEMYNTFDQISDTYGYESGYSDDTLWRTSLLDSDIYGHPVAGTGKLISAGTDYSDIPYMNNGVGAEGLQTSSIIEFQSANLEFNLVDCDVEYESDTDDFNYLIVSESGSSAITNFTDCDNLNGIIWNQGTGAAIDNNGGVNQDNNSTGGAAGDSAADAEETFINVNFDNSTFTGNFADGYYGLWNVDGLSYTDNIGCETSINGNYYAKSANWGITADFLNGSVWNVEGNSYIGSLTIDNTSSIRPADGAQIAIYTDVTDISDLGEPADSLESGTYENVIIITDEDAWAECLAAAQNSVSQNDLDNASAADGDTDNTEMNQAESSFPKIPVIITIIIAAIIICCGGYIYKRKNS